MSHQKLNQAKENETIQKIMDTEKNYSPLHTALEVASTSTFKLI